MRVVVSVLIGLACASAVAAGKRYAIEPDRTAYPQGTPKETLASVLKAAEAGRYDYLTAQLADPAFVDDRVRRIHGGDFKHMVEDTRDRLDPSTVKLLARFQKDGAWTIDKDQARVTLADVPDRQVRFRRLDGRWYLENRWAPESKK